MTCFIDERRDVFGVECVCGAIGMPVSTYYARKSRKPSRVYGARKTWRHLGRNGVDAGRDRVARLMRQEGLEDVRRGKKRCTTTPDEKRKQGLSRIRTVARSSSLAYTDRLDELGIALSAESKGDALDNAMAEAWVATYKTELIDGYRFVGFEDVEHETFRWISFWRSARLSRAGRSRGSGVPEQTSSEVTSSASCPSRRAGQSWLFSVDGEVRRVATGSQGNQRRLSAGSAPRISPGTYFMLVSERGE